MIKQIDKYFKYLEWQLTTYRGNHVISFIDYFIYSDDLSRAIGC
jgi:hypothetical protein